MSQNLLSLTLADDTLASIDSALDSLEAAFVNLIALSARFGSRRRSTTPAPATPEA
ncbi:hypothetical protein ACO2Q2_07200 [Dyella sp. KRB-257]|uniref:hypothetical protein n=1 Tax=Dyella sp. KRB-257 TaxID=3400915 RepID=UPI003C0EEA38